MSGWNTEEVPPVGDVDVTTMGNVVKDATKDETPQSSMNVEAVALAREKGWVEPQSYDYSVYTAEKPAEDGDAPVWASAAAKYEWSDEYGDIGPPNEELEKMLFHSEFISRAGIKLDQ